MRASAPGKFCGRLHEGQHSHREDKVGRYAATYTALVSSGGIRSCHRTTYFTATDSSMPSLPSSKSFARRPALLISRGHSSRNQLPINVTAHSKYRDAAPGTKFLRGFLARLNGGQVNGSQTNRRIFQRWHVSLNSTDGLKSLDSERHARYTLAPCMTSCSP